MKYTEAISFEWYQNNRQEIEEHIKSIYIDFTLELAEVREECQRKLILLKQEHSYNISVREVQHIKDKQELTNRHIKGMKELKRGLNDR